MFDEPVIEISTKEVVTITPDTSVGTAISIMEKNKFHNLVVRASEGVYLVNIQDLLLASNSDSQVDEFMFKPHSIHKDTPTIDAIRELMDSGQRAAPVVNDDDALVGIVTEYDFMKRGSESRLLKDVQVRRMMNRNPICVEETDSIGKARSIMRKDGVGRVLVVDEMSDLLGIVTGGDILKKVYKPKRRMTSGEFKGEKVTRMEQPVSVIMNAPVITADIDANLAEVANLLQQHDIRGVPIVKDRVPRGIVTIQDILRYLRTLREEAMVEVEIQGTLDEEYKDLAERIIETEVRKIAKFARRMQWIKIVIKKEHDRGGVPYYKITAQVKTPDKLYVGGAEPKPIKTITATAEDVVEETKVRKRRWDFIGVLKDALLSVERQIEEDRGRKRTQNRKALEK
ncbi:MAG TPA: CBS domain-containing protein [Desulfobacteria bacterium]|nr:CBS domain-containing protein [Desulfobacteria bacterium]